MPDWGKRFATGFVLVPSIIFLIQYSFTIKILTHVVIFLSMKEFQKMIISILKLHSSSSEHHYIEIILGQNIFTFIPGHLTMLATQYFESETILHIMLLVSACIFCALRIQQFISHVQFSLLQKKEKVENDLFFERRMFVLTFLQISADIFGYVVFAFPLNFALLLFPVKQGIGYIILWLIASWQTDNGALFLGSLIGKTPFSPLVSPKKTWEGIAGAFFLSIISLFIFSLFKSEDSLYVPNIPTKHYLIIAIIIAFISICGDFLESFVKRAANMKDSGNLLPGHGGMLDRMDSLVISAPVVYFYCKLIIGSIQHQKNVSYLNNHKFSIITVNSLSI